MKGKKSSYNLMRMCEARSKRGSDAMLLLSDKECTRPLNECFREVNSRCSNSFPMIRRSVHQLTLRPHYISEDGNAECSLYCEKRYWN